ncbi:MAG: 4Fe-4S binding protein [Chloroflexi bacterium]|nr:4Fe-4S binding protein [Chloroflexota bacterium]
MGIRIDEEKCIGCGLCEIACAYDAIDVLVKATVDNSLCTDCNACPDYCPTDAIEMEIPVASSFSTPTEASFDVVVIGSGLGGLCSGALLADRGYKVLVLERNPSVGGRFSSLRHKNLMLPTGGSLIGLGGPLQQVCEQVGAPFDVVPFDVSAYWVKGKGWVNPGPGSGQLRRALVDISGEPDAVQAVMAGMKDALTSGNYPSGSLLQWLGAVSDNKDIEQIFRGIIAAAFGPEDVPAADFFQLIAATSGKGMGLSRRGLIHLMGGLAKAIRDRGGEVWTRAEVEAITLDGKTSTGVQVSRRGQPCSVTARSVISNAGPHQTMRLLDGAALDERYTDRLDERVQPVTSISIHLISDRDLLGNIPGAVYTVVGGRRICMIFDATSITEWAPPGTHITEIYPLTVESPDTPVDWQAQVDEALLDMDDMTPGWREGTRVQALCMGTEFPGLHAWPGAGVDIDTPIANLLLVGDGVESRGYAGGAAAAASALRAADVAQERLARA